MSIGPIEIYLLSSQLTSLEKVNEIVSQAPQLVSSVYIHPRHRLSQKEEMCNPRNKAYGCRYCTQATSWLKLNGRNCLPPPRMPLAISSQRVWIFQLEYLISYCPARPVEERDIATFFYNGLGLCLGAKQVSTNDRSLNVSIVFKLAPTRGRKKRLRPILHGGRRYSEACL